MKKTTTEYTIGTKIDLHEQGSTQEGVQLVYGGLKRIRARIKLEARMAAYDALHRTSYRKLYRAVETRDRTIARNAAFEASIGIVRGK